MAKETGGDVLDKESAQKALFPGTGLPGGGQLEIRMEASANHPDPDIRGVARRVKAYNLESWCAEWTAVAQKNEVLAQGFERDQRKLTANEFYLRATDFYRRALLYMPDSDPRMLPAYKKLKETFEKAWTLIPPPFERVQIPYEGDLLDGLFYCARGKAGNRFPVVYNYAGAGSCFAAKKAPPINPCAVECHSSTSMVRDTGGR